MVLCIILEPDSNYATRCYEHHNSPMNISALFILRPVMTTLVMMTAVIMGIFAYRAIPVSNLPDVDYPTITVNVPFPGANPSVMANTVASPLEKAFMAIPGIKYVTSANILGSSIITLTFETYKNIDLAAVDVEAAIASVKSKLPPNLPQDPTYKKVNPSASPILYIALTSPTLTLGELYDYGNTLIGQRISILEGVAEVDVNGSPFAVRSQIDPGQIASMGLTAQEIAAAINRSNQYLPLGQLDGDQIAPPLYDNGALKRASEFSKVIVAYKNGSPIYLKDVSTTIDSIAMDRTGHRYIDKNINQPSVVLSIKRQAGANAIQLADRIHHLLAQLSPLLPGSVELYAVFDRSESIRESLLEVEITLLIALFLVVLVIFVYLGRVRDTIIPSIVMPLSIIATLTVIYLLGYTLDTLSLLAFTLAIGFMVDDAIVVLENIVRRVEEGNPPLEAALAGSKQICFTIVSMTLSLIAVFIPLMFMAGIIGKLFQEFAITLTVVTLISGIISLTLTPMLCARFIPKDQNQEKSWMAHFSHRLNSWMLDYYQKALSVVLKHQGTVLILGILSVIVSAFLFTILPKDFIPDEDIGFMIAYTESEQGTSSEKMRGYQSQIVEILRQEPAIISLVSITGSPVYRQGIIFIRLTPKNQRQAINQLIPEYYQKIGNIPGINVFLKNIPLIDLNIGSQARGAYQYLITSLDAEALYSSAQKLYEKMLSDPAFQGVSSNLEIKTPQINFNIERERANSLGVDVESIEQALLLGFSANRISRIQTPINQYDVILELNREMQKSMDSLASIYVRSKTSQQIVPLDALASWSEGVGPTSINHFAQFPAVTISFDLAPGIALSDGLTHLRQLASESFTPQVIGDVKGAAETFEETVRSISFLLLVTVLVIYIVLGILYESFIHPLTILSTLPPAIVGALLTLYFTGRPLSLYAYLGIILLVGIVKKNGIMIVDFALDNIRSKGESPEKSIFDACLVRFRPIMMTTMAAIMGALPIALAVGAGAESRRPLGYVIIGGMCISQLITLFLTPVIYLYLERLRERFMPKATTPNQKV